MVAAAALAFALAACSSGAGSDATTHGPDGTASSATSGFVPAGAPLAGDLAVPEGTRLAGAVFFRPGVTRGPDDWTAYLVVDGDPFAAWDDLAGQVRNGGHPADLSGSADACTWTWPDDVPPPHDGPAGKGMPVVPLPADGAAPPTTTVAPPAVDPYLAAITITSKAPPAEVDGVECSASATAVVDGTNVRYSAHLRSGARWPATISVAATSDRGDLRTAATAWRTSLEMQSRRGGGPDLVPGPGRVPQGASDYVSEPEEQPAPKDGGAFGTEVNCFVGRGYDRLRLPSGGSFVAGSFDDGTVSVISVDDGAAATSDIQEQTAGDGTSADGSGTVEVLSLADGREVTEFSFGISGGGGGCGATTSPDGRFLLVSVHGD